MDPTFDLVTDGFHAGNGGMAALFVDVFQFNAGYTVVGTDGADRLVDRFGEFTIQDKVNLHIRIAQLGLLQQVGQSGTELEQILLFPVGILILTDGCTGPTVVRAAENEQDVRIAQVVQTGNEYPPSTGQPSNRRPMPLRVPLQLPYWVSWLPK